MNRIRLAPIAIAGCTLLMWNNAFAYIDPGTGSLLIQWLFGAAVAGFAVVNIYWERAKAFLLRNSGSSGHDQDVDGTADEAGRD